MKKCFLLLAILSALLFVSGCDKGVTPIAPATTASHDETCDEHDHGQQAEKKPSMETMAAAAQQAPRTIVEPDFLKGAWKGAILKVVVKETGQATTVEVPLGRRVPLQGTDLQVEVSHFFPSFIMTPDSITSVSNELNNPAAKLQILQGEKVLMDSWIFSKMPQVHGFVHEMYEVTLVEGVRVPVE